MNGAHINYPRFRTGFHPDPESACYDHTHGKDNPWTHDDDHVRREAAALCSGCPVIAQCYAHGKKHKEFGVWGGVDLGTRTRPQPK